MLPEGAGAVRTVGARAEPDSLRGAGALSGAGGAAREAGGGRGGGAGRPLEAARVRGGGVGPERRQGEPPREVRAAGARRSAAGRDPADSAAAEARSAAPLPLGCPRTPVRPGIRAKPRPPRAAGQTRTQRALFPDTHAADARSQVAVPGGPPAERHPAGTRPAPLAPAAGPAGTGRPAAAEICPQLGRDLSGRAIAQAALPPRG